MLLDKEQIWVIFLFKFKMSHKAAETTCNINHAFGLGTANIQCSGGSRSFAKETRTLEMRSAMADHRKLTTTNGEQFLKVILLQLQEKFPRTQHQPFYSFFGIWNKLESGCLMSWPQVKKNHNFEVWSSLILHNNNKSFLNRIVMCDQKWLLCDRWRWQAQWLDQEEAPEHFPKPNLHQKKVMVTVWWSAAHWIHYSFPNPSKTITSEKCAQQIDEMHPKLQRLQSALVNRKGPILLYHDNAQPHIAQPML